MTPLAIRLERADAAMLAHGPAAQKELLRQIEAAIRSGDDPEKVRDLDHVLQLIEFRERTRFDAAARDWSGARGLALSDSGTAPFGD